jgi:hypothetical protein
MGLEQPSANAVELRDGWKSYIMMMKYILKVNELSPVNVGFYTNNQPIYMFRSYGYTPINWTAS